MHKNKTGTSYLAQPPAAIPTCTGKRLKVYGSKSLVLLATLALAACGTLPSQLLEEESRFSWQADSVLSAAESLDRGFEDGVYEAEAAKFEACEPIIEAARARVAEGDNSFGKQFLSDLMQLIAYLIPIRSVENCAMAQQHYVREVVKLCEHLGQKDSSLSCEDQPTASGREETRFR